MLRMLEGTDVMYETNQTWVEYLENAYVLYRIIL